MRLSTRLALSITVSMPLLFGCAGSTAPKGNPLPLRAAPVRVLMQTSQGDITLELDAARAPISTGNFLMHAAAGHYDGTIFHRVIPSFVIQGGGWNPDLTDRSKIAKDAGLPDATIINEWTNGLKNTRGTIAMAREPDADSATREFYINVADNARLDTARETTGNAGYAVFGRVVDGLEVVDIIKSGKIMNRPDIAPNPEDGALQDVPVKPVVIVKVVRL